MMGVAGVGPRRERVKIYVEELDEVKVGTYHQNPLMYTQYNELEYDDRTHDRCFTNVIAENLYSQVDSEGHQFFILEDISDNMSYGTAIDMADGS